MAFGQPPADLHISIQLAQQLIYEQFPELARLDLTEFDAGWDNVLFRLGPDLAARFPRRHESIACIQAEIDWLPTLARQLPLPTPAPIHIGQPSNQYPSPWTIVPWLPGEPADLHPLDPAEDIAIAQFFAALHRPAPANAPENDYRGVPLQEVQARRARDSNPIEPHLTPHQNKLWQQALNAPLPEGNCWIHGDLHPLNALTADGKLTAILDWGDLTSGDPACDLARFYMLFTDPDAILARTSDPATVSRARGWALHFGVTHQQHGEHGQPRHAEVGRKTLETLSRARLIP